MQQAAEATEDEEEQAGPEKEEEEQALAEQEGEELGVLPELHLGKMIRANDNSVVKKGTFGVIVAFESGKEFGIVRWEQPHLGARPGVPHEPDRVALEGRFKYIVEDDDDDLPPMALRSGLGAVASLHGTRVLKATGPPRIERAGILTHMVADLSHLQSGTVLHKQLGFLSAYIYSGSLRELAPVEEPYQGENDEDAASDEEDWLSERRLRAGDVFFVHKEGPSACVEEMYVFVGVAEEYEMHRPTLPTAEPTMRKPALLGLRFKRSVVDKEPKLCFLQGSSRSLEHDLAQVVLSAVPLTDQVYTIRGNTETLFGPELLRATDKVLRTSSLFAAHREHGLLRTGDASSFCSQLKSLARGQLSKKSPEALHSILTALHAQMLYGLAQTKARTFASLKKASAAVLAETRMELNHACVESIGYLRKHVCWLLGAMKPDVLKAVLLKLQEAISPLQQAAFATLDLPEEVPARVQDAIPGQEGGEENANALLPPPKSKRTRVGGDATGGAKKLKGDQRLEMLMAQGGREGQQPSPASELAAQLKAQLGKLPCTEEVESLRAKLREETMRADREALRAESEAKTAAALREELSALRTSINDKAAEPPTMQESEEVKQLKSEITFLRRTNAALTMMLGGERACGAEFLKSGL